MVLCSRNVILYFALHSQVKTSNVAILSYNKCIQILSAKYVYIIWLIISTLILIYDYPSFLPRHTHINVHMHTMNTWTLK